MKRKRNLKIKLWYFFYSFLVVIISLTTSLFAARITVYVKDGSGKAITNGKVAFAGIPNDSMTGDPDPNNIKVIPLNPEGKAVLEGAPANYAYIVVADVPGYGPTFTEQVHSPNYTPVTITNFSDNKTINRIVYPLPASNY